MNKKWYAVTLPNWQFEEFRTVYLTDEQFNILDEKLSKLDADCGISIDCIDDENCVISYEELLNRIPKQKEHNRK